MKKSPRHQLSFLDLAVVILLNAVVLTAGTGTAAGADATVSERPQVTIRPRIVNGDLTGAYPAVGTLLVPSDPDSAISICSGTLIGCETFLTAAHCVCPTIGLDCQPGAFLAPDPSSYAVFLQHGGFFTVSSIAVHPNYGFPVADVAVLKLTQAVTGIAPTPINSGTVPAVGTSARIVGFGRSGGLNSDYGLKRVGAVELAPCRLHISDETSLCWDFTNPVGPQGTDSNTCQGDSGGPLLIDFGCGDTVAGTTSGGVSGACQPTDRSFDANVYAFRDFVAAEGGADLANAACGDMPQAGDPNTDIVAMSGTLDAATSQAMHSLTVSAGATLLRISMNATDNGSNFDLYVKQGSPPTVDDFDCAAPGSGQFGFCEFSSPLPGTWHALLVRRSGLGLYQLTATIFGSGSPGQGSNGQSCDDRNPCTTNDACQAGTCTATPLADGTSCDDGKACTAADQCLGGSCTGTAAPAASCRKPVLKGAASLLVLDRPLGLHDRLFWNWSHGAATARADFGDPTAATSHELCIFDQSAGVPQLVFDARIPPGGHWSATALGFRYDDKLATNAGVRRVLLREGGSGHAAVQVKGKGPGLGPLGLPFDQDGKAIVQLLNPNACWEAEYSTSERDTSRQFKARSD